MNPQKTLINLEGFADKSVQNLLNSINKSKEKNFDKVLFGLGINMIGSTNGIVQWLLTKTAFRRLASFDPSIARP